MQEQQKPRLKETRVPVGLWEEMEPLRYRPSEISPWFEEPFREFESVFREPMLWPLGSRMGTFAPALRPWVTPSIVPRFGETRLPLVDLEDKGTEFLVTAEMPGIPKENVEVNVTDRWVDIRAETLREEEKREKEFFRRERLFKELHRRLPLPAEIVPAEVAAKLEDGLLKIVLPKKEPTPAPKKLKVKVA